MMAPMHGKEKTQALGPAAAALAAALLLTSGASVRADTAANVVPSNGLKLTIPYNALGVGTTPLWVAIDSGYFRRYGIDVTPGGAMQSPAIVASMLSGESPFAIAGEDAAISADLNGGDIEIVAAGTQKLHFTVHAVPSVHTVADLKGRKLGVTQFGTTTDFIARYVLKQAGLRPGSDVTILPMGAQATMFAALRDEKIDAGVLGSEVALQADLLGSLNPIMSMLDSDLLF
jgi:NitT/TauT family transport system substrate-binding protein